MASTFPLLRLPLELREQIFSLYFQPSEHFVDGECGGGQYNFDLRLFRVSKQVRTEARDVFRRENIFVRIETPWPQAENHIVHEGHVPIVAAGHKGDLFDYHYASIQISAPLYEFVPTHALIVLLDDLHLFCQVWYYSALNYRTLNDHLSVTFALQDKCSSGKPLPLSIQRRLLLPFEKVKGLYEVKVENFDKSVESELRARMAIPYDSVQKCLENSTKLMQSGDKALSEGDAPGALEIYNKAFHAMHIIIAGRTRRIQADAWFHEAIESGPYAGQTGPTVRITLRIRLVARTVLAYLKMRNWEEAAFWGMRSVRLMREAVDAEFEDFLAEFVGASDVGMIYFRTAIAFTKLEESGSKELPVYAKQDKETGEREALGNSKKLFELSGRFVKGQNAGTAWKEALEFGVQLPPGVLKGASGSDVDSMSHMEMDGEDEQGRKEGSY